MNRFLRVILRERLDFASVSSGSFTGEEGERAVSGLFVFTMRHGGMLLVSSEFEVRGAKRCELHGSKYFGNKSLFWIYRR